MLLYKGNQDLNTPPKSNPSLRLTSTHWIRRVCVGGVLLGLVLGLVLGGVSKAGIPSVFRGFRRFGVSLGAKCLSTLLKDDELRAEGRRERSGSLARTLESPKKT